MEVKTLGELCNIVSGGTPSRSKAEFWHEGTIPWIKIGNIKEKYVKVMEAYKEGYTKMLEACDTNDEQTVTEATEKIDEGIKLLDDYNNALESLAKEKDMKIEY